MTKRFFFPLLLTLVLSATAFGAGGSGERIRSFHSEIVVNEDGSLHVTESITVHAEGQQIKRGIYRDFPTLYRGRLFSRHAVPFDIVKITRDSQPEAYHTKPLQNGMRVYIGRKETLLKSGEYTYTLTYTTNRQLGFFGDHDELYWNVTGNGWAFAIEKASACVTLPASIPPDDIRLEGYTGPQGAKGKDFTSAFDADGRPLFSTTRPLNSFNGLTIVVSWPPGHIHRPTRADKLRWMVRDNRGVAIGLLGCILLVVYYSWAWVMVGRDPEKGTIIPIFDPPDDLSPAAICYVREMGFDNRCLTAAAIDMAVKGRVKIEFKDGDYALSRLEGRVDDLAPEQQALAKTIVNRKLWFRQTYHRRIRAMINRFKKSLAAQFSKGYFKLNRAYLIPGIIVSFLVFAAAGILTPSPGGDVPPSLFITLWLSFWSLGVAALLRQAWRQWRTVLAGGGKVAQAIGISLFALPFLGGEVFGLWILIRSTTLLILLVFACLAVTDLVFAYLLKAYSQQGRKLMDRIEGFRMYLCTAEQRTMDLARAPERTPELFEKYLPYALALGVESQWADQFADELLNAGEEYSPSWYVGRNFAALGAAGFATSMGSSMSSAIASSSTAPGSSSGSGGGGSSGGGGGGGGGGGW